VRQSTVHIIGVPIDLGAGRRGVDMGPSALRIAGLDKRIGRLGFEVLDAGDLDVRIPEELAVTPSRQMYLDEITRVCDLLSHKVREALDNGHFPLVLGGDHSIGAGTASGTAAHYRDRGERIGLIWLDAHTDINTPETSPSGNVHGMPVAALTGLGPEELAGLEGFCPKVDPSCCVIIGARDVDPLERENIRRSGVRVVTMTELDKRGMSAVMEEVLELVCRGTAGFHCSLDLDVVDPQFAPGVGTPVQGGITYRESHLAMEMIGDSGRLLSLECVELNPVLDVVNRTGELGVELVCSALGQKIL
jgi:arginase